MSRRKDGIIINNGYPTIFVFRLREAHINLLGNKMSFLKLFYLLDIP